MVTMVNEKDIGMTGGRILRIVTGFLFYREQLLLLRRSSSLRNYPGKWGGVSGYLEPGVDPLRQVYREIKEELGLEAEVLELKRRLKPVDVTDDKAGITWRVFPFVFVVKTCPGIELNRENAEFAWIDPAQVPDFDTVPGLAEVLEYACKE